MFSSNDMTWETPQWLFDKLDKEFHFTFDVCASANNTKCNKYWNVEQDALKHNWAANKEVYWMNPPYGREVGVWIEKAYNESLKGATVVCLIPSRTDTKYWHDYCMKASEIRFIKGRLKFGDSKNSAPFPSAIVIFNRKQNSNIKISTY